MGLRPKALFSAILLVAGVTTVMGLWATRFYCESEEKHISREITVTTQQLVESIETSRLRTQLILTSYVTDGNFVKNVVRGETIKILKDEFKVFINNALKQTKVDYGLVYFDKFVAEDSKREPTVLAEYEDLLACAFVSRPGDPNFATTQRDLLSDPSLQTWVQKIYNAAELPNTRTILTINQRMYLVIPTFLVESLQAPEENVVGVALLLKELSHEWALSQLESSGLNNKSNPTRMILHSAHTVIAHVNIGQDEANSILMNEVGKTRYTRKATGEEFITYTSPLTDNRTAGLVIVKSLDKEIEQPIAEMTNRLITVGAILGLFGVFFAYTLANTAVSRVKTLQKIAGKVQRGDFSQTVTPVGNDELTRLGEAFNDMTKGLTALGIYTDPTLAASVVQGDIHSSVDKVTGTIFFSDIAGFTPITESMDKELLVERLNDYFTIMGAEIKRTRGYLDKFIGDAIMAFWGEPLYKGNDYAIMACRAALACHEAGQRLAAQHIAKKTAPFHQRIGIATGEIIVGNIGSTDKKNFTVIGDDVNLASRLEGANKFYNTAILIDQATATRVSKDFLVREIDQICVKGKSVAMPVFELMATQSGAHNDQEMLANAYYNALSSYRARRFSDALNHLHTCLAVWPDDGPGRWLKQVCEALQSTPPEDDWEPITIAAEK